MNPSCNAKKAKESDNSVTQQFKKTLENWHLKCNVDSEIKDDSLIVDIHFLGHIDSTATFHYDEESNEVIVRMLAYNNKQLLKPYLKTVVYVHLQGTGAKGTYIIDENAKKIINQYFSNDSFHSNVLYCLENFTIQEFNLVRYALHNVSSDFDRKVATTNFWEVLYQYSNFCNDKNENDKIAVKQVLIIAGMLDWDKDKNDLAFSTSEKFNHFLDRCNINKKVFKLNESQLEEFIDYMIKTYHNKG